MNANELLCSHIVKCVDATAPLRWGDPIDGVDEETLDDVRRLAEDAHALYNKLRAILRAQEK